MNGRNLQLMQFSTRIDDVVGGLVLDADHNQTEPGCNDACAGEEFCYHEGSKVC